MPPPRKRLFWELSRSRYLLWTLVPGLNWLAFLTAAREARQPRWRPWAWAYAAVPAVTLAGMALGLRELGAIAIYVGMVTQPLSLLHALALRRAYLKRVAALEAKPPAAPEPRPGRRRFAPVGRETRPLAMEGPPGTLPLGPARTRELPPEPVWVAPEPDAAPDRLDVNTAPEEALAAVEAIGPVLAQRTVAMREVMGPFANLGQYAERLGIGPEAFDGLRARAYVASEEA